jgi:hypothetical protein
MLATIAQARQAAGIRSLACCEKNTLDESAIVSLIT